MKAPYVIKLTIEIFSNQIKDGIEFADARNSPYTLTQVVNTCFNVLFKT